MRRGRGVTFRKSTLPASRTLEKEIQNEICMIFDAAIETGAKFQFAGDMNAGRRSPNEAMWAKACGMKAGETDMRIYCDGGKIILIELKVKSRGSVSREQKERHDKLRALGFDVRVWRLRDRPEGREYAKALIAEIT